MSRDHARLSILSMLKVGTLGFGGGSALIPLIGEELVDRRQLVSAKSFTKHTVVSSVTPGALPVKLATLAGMEISGAWLALLLAVAVALPGTLGTLLLVAGVEGGGADIVRYVEYASIGITVFIIALLTHYVGTVISRSHFQRVAVLVTVASAAVTGVEPAVEFTGRLLGQHWRVEAPQLTTVQLIAAALLIIVAKVLLAREAGPKAAHPPARGRLLTPLLLRTVGLLTAVLLAAALTAWVVSGAGSLEILGLVAISTLTSFGGGEAYVAVADGMFVGGGHVPGQVFYGQLVPIANALPGPILIKLAAAIGYGAAQGGALQAWTLGVAAALVALAACTMVAVLVMAVFERAPDSRVIRDIGRFILPVICGLLVTTSLSMLNVAAEVVERTALPSTGVLWAAVAAVPVVLWARERRVHDLILIGVCGTVSLGAALLAG